MNPQKTNFFVRQTRRFNYAFAGISVALAGDLNVRIHLAIAFVVTVLGFFAEISTTEWLIQFLFIALVMSLEMINSALELLTDEQFKSLHPVAKNVKDISAGAVLVASIGAFIAGCVIYWPTFKELLGLFQ